MDVVENLLDEALRLQGESAEADKLDARVVLIDEKHEENGTNL